VKKKALVLAACMAFTAPSVSVAQVFPDSIVGLNLGEIQSSSHLNEPFKGVIPFLFTSIESSNKLTVKLAPASIYKQVGAEKLPILNNLNFRIGVKNGKPVVLINSTRPIQLPFLNFVLEITGPKGSIYQDYTVLLDPPSKQAQQASVALQKPAQEPLLLETYSAPNLANKSKSNYTVKSGDSLSKIAAILKPKGISLRKMVASIYSRNPNAFIGNNKNRIKRGAVLDIPSYQEINGFNQISSKTTKMEKSKKQQNKKPLLKLEGETYKVVKGDNLTKITKKFVYSDVSFTKMMSSIHIANPHAFSKNKINRLKVNSVLRIPSLEEIAHHNIDSISVEPQKESLILKQKISNEIEKTSETDQAANNKPESSSDQVSQADSTPIADAENNEEQVINPDIEPAETITKSNYIVQKGDSLTKITKKIGYQDVSFSKMMKAIYISNQDAFVSNNITKLKIGAEIKLPALEEVLSGMKKNTAEEIRDEQSSDTTTSASSGTNKLVLQRRIRELRDNFNRSKNKIDKLQQTLNAQEDLIYKKDSEIVKLKSKIIKSKLTGQASTEITELYAENVELPAKKAFSADGKLEISGASSLVNAIYQDAKSTKNLGYISMALILGLLLIRYRREIYSYTRLTAGDYLSYYPASDAATLKPEAKDLNYIDTLVDPAAEKDFLPESSKPVKAEPETPNPEFSDSTSDEEQNSEEIKHCDNLITELLDDLKTESELSPESDWESIEKVCDHYLESLDLNAENENYANEKPNESSIADFDLMMADLLKNVDKGKEAIKAPDSSLN